MDGHAEEGLTIPMAGSRERVQPQDMWSGAVRSVPPRFVVLDQRGLTSAAASEEVVAADVSRRWQVGA